jgi:hypothetical protein
VPGGFAATLPHSEAHCTGCLIRRIGDYALRGLCVGVSVWRIWGVDAANLHGGGAKCRFSREFDGKYGIDRGGLVEDTLKSAVEIPILYP